MSSLLVAFAAGVLTVLAPCTLPVAVLVLGGGSLGGYRRAIGIGIGFAGAFLASAVLLASALAAVNAQSSD